MKVFSHAKTIAVVLALAVAAASCGATETVSTPATGEAGASAFPNVDVTRIDNSATTNLSETLSGGDQAILLWFFAPH